MKLNEVTAWQVEAWLKINLPKNSTYKIRPSGLVDVLGDVDLDHLTDAKMPVRFGDVSGGFVAMRSHLATLEGLPQRIGGNFYCPKIKSLSGIEKIVKYVGGAFLFTKNINPTHILGTLLIAGVTEYNFDRDGPIDNIMNKYIGTGDIIGAQDELIDAGFKEQARL
jgi:hypothetical protein